MSKITAFTDDTPYKMTPEIEQKLIDEFFEASRKAAANGEVYQRAWLFTSKDDDVISEMKDWIATGCNIINEDANAKDKQFIGRCKKAAIAGAVIGAAVFGYKKWKVRKAKKLQNKESEDKLKHAVVKAKKCENKEAEDDE